MILRIFMRYERVSVCRLFSLSTSFSISFKFKAPLAIQAEISLLNCSLISSWLPRLAAFFSCWESHLMITAHWIREHVYCALRIILTENHHTICLTVHCVSVCCYVQALALVLSTTWTKEFNFHLSFRSHFTFHTKWAKCIPPMDHFWYSFPHPISLSLSNKIANNFFLLMLRRESHFQPPDFKPRSVGCLACVCENQTVCVWNGRN